MTLLIDFKALTTLNLVTTQFNYDVLLGLVTGFSALTHLHLPLANEILRGTRWRITHGEKKHIETSLQLAQIRWYDW
jgi:hypothetical protein